MQSVLLVIELIVAAALIVVVLLQKSEGGALGMGGGGGAGGLFTPRGAGDALSKTTGYLAAVFFVVCIALNLYALHGGSSGSILRDSGATPAKSGTTPTVPILPSPTPSSPQVPKPN